MENLTEAVKELEEASRLLIDRQSEAAVARSAETEALNRVNQAQKRVDGILSDARKSAPHGTDWRRTQ